MTISTEDLTPADYILAKVYTRDNPNMPWPTYDAFQWFWKNRASNGVNATKVAVKVGGSLFVVPKRIPTWMDWQADNTQKLSA